MLLYLSIILRAREFVGIGLADIFGGRGFAKFGVPSHAIGSFLFPTFEVSSYEVVELNSFFFLSVRKNRNHGGGHQIYSCLFLGKSRNVLDIFNFE